MDTEGLVCERDGVPTQLRCAQCAAGICPTCMVRTPVGFKCPACAGEARVARRRSPLLLAAVGAAAVVALALGASMLGSSGGGASDPVGQSPAPEGPARAQASIGEEVRDGQLAFVVEDFACRARSPETAAPQAPGKVCTLKVRIRNPSNSPATLLGRFQYLLDAQSKTYGPDEGLTRAVPENGGRSLSEINVNPDVVVALVLVFDIPETVEPTEARFRGTGRSRFGVNVRLQRPA